MLFKFLPDVELSWRDVLMGALVTAVLFAIGKEVIGLYLGQEQHRVELRRGRLGAGSLALGVLLLADRAVGAEFTRLHADRVRGPVPTERFAEVVDAPPGSVEARAPVA